MRKFDINEKVVCVVKDHEDIVFGNNYIVDIVIENGLLISVEGLPGWYDEDYFCTVEEFNRDYNATPSKPEFIGKHPHYEVKFPGGTQAPKFNHSGSKYLRDIKTTIDGKIDVYAVLIAFNVVSPTRQHAIKKLLCAGIRGKNDELNDIQEAKDAIERDIQLLNN